MANPKKRTSSRKRNNRRSHIRMTVLPSMICGNCQERKLRHRVCPHCGHYKGTQVVLTEAE